MTARGHEEPFAVQFSLFLANRVGQLKDLLDVLAQRNLLVIGISIVDATDWAVIRMILSDPGKARELFKTHALPFTESPVLLVCLEEDTSLAKACALLMQVEVNVHFAYPLTIRREDHPVMVLHVDVNDTATQMLIRHGFVLLGEEDLAN